MCVGVCALKIMVKECAIYLFPPQFPIVGRCVGCAVSAGYNGHCGSPHHEGPLWTKLTGPC